MVSCNQQPNEDGDYVCGWDEGDDFCIGYHCEVCSISLCSPDCGDEYCARTRSPADREQTKCMLCAHPLEDEEYDTDLETWVKDGNKIEWDGLSFSYPCEECGIDPCDCTNYSAETFEAKGYAPDKPFYATTHENWTTTVMHPINCGHYKMVMNGTGVWMSPTFYDTIEEMFTDKFDEIMDTQAEGMIDYLDTEIGQETKRKYQAIKTIGDARKFAKRHFDFKIDFAPCFRKERDYDSKALNALPITVAPIYDEDYWDAEYNVEFNDWADQEMMSHGKDISFKDWAEDEGMKHGDVPITDWAQHEEESHDARYGGDVKNAEHSNTIGFSQKGFWKTKKPDANLMPRWSEKLTRKERKKREKEAMENGTELDFPYVDASTVAMITKIVDGEPMRGGGSVNMPRLELPDTMTMTWGEIKALGKDEYETTLGDSKYPSDLLDRAFKKLPTDTVMKIQNGPNYPAKITFEYGGDEWMVYVAPRVDRLSAENWGGDPKGKLAVALQKARDKAKEPKKPLKIEKLDAEFLYYYVLNEKGESPADFDTLEEAQAYVANSSEPLEIYERRSRDDEAYKMDKKMNAETSGQWEIGEQLEEAQMNAENYRYVKPVPISHSGGGHKYNGYYAIKGYEKPTKDGFTYRILSSPGTKDWYRVYVYDDEKMFQNKSRRLNPSGKMVGSSNPASHLIGSFPRLDDAKRALVFRMIQDEQYYHILSNGNLNWLLYGKNPGSRKWKAESFSAPRKGIDTFSKPFEEASLDSGGMKKWIVAATIGGLAYLGYKNRK